MKHKILPNLLLLFVLAATAAQIFSQSKEVTDSKTALAEKLFNRGIVNQNNNDLMGALADFTRAILIAPKNGKYYVARAQTLVKRGGAEFALRDLAVARFYKYNETEIAETEKTAYDSLGERPTDLNAFLKARQEKMSKFAYSKLPEFAEAVPYCTSFEECLKRGESALQVANYADRMQSIFYADEALRLAPDNPDALMLRSRGFATLTLDTGDPIFAGTNFCDSAVRDARSAVEKNPNLVTAGSDDLWILIENNAAIRRAPYFFCAEYAKSNPARQTIDAARTERVAEVQKEWEAENEKIRKENSIPGSVRKPKATAAENAVADYEKLYEQLQQLDKEYDREIKKIERQIEKDQKSGIQANLFMKAERRRAQTALDTSRRLITEFLEKYDRVLSDETKNTLQDWLNRLPTSVPI